VAPDHDEFEPGLTGNENDPVVLHYPFVRHVRLGWYHDEHGQWASAEFDESRWEVVCPQCGDDDGPVDQLPEEIRGLRGPYSSKHQASHVANKHTRDWDPSPRWTPGATIPLD